MTLETALAIVAGISLVWFGFWSAAGLFSFRGVTLRLDPFFSFVMLASLGAAGWLIVRYLEAL